MSKKRRMVAFRINEISAVDFPAQAHAKLVMVKRADRGDQMPKESKKGLDICEAIAKMYIDPMNGALTFAEVLDLEMQANDYYEIMDKVCPLIYSMETSLKSIAGDRALDSNQKLNMMRDTVEGFMATMRSKWEGMESMVHDLVGKLEEEPDMAKTMKQLMDENAALTAQLEEAKKASTGEGDSDAIKELTEKVNALTAELEKAQAEKADAVAKAGLTDAERAFHATLDAENASEFLKMQPKARAAFMKSADETDETLTVNGRTIRKSTVGEEVFEMMKAQDAQMKDLAKQAEKDRDERINTELRKRVSDEFDKLPGTDDAKVSVLKAMVSMPEAARTALEAMLKAGNAALSGAFTRLGHNDGNVLDINKGRGVQKDAEHPFMKKVNEIKATEKVTGSTAMSLARKRFPDEYADFAGKDDESVA